MPHLGSVVNALAVGTALVSGRGLHLLLAAGLVGVLLLRVVARRGVVGRARRPDLPVAGSLPARDDRRTLGDLPVVVRGTRPWPRPATRP